MDHGLIIELSAMYEGEEVRSAQGEHKEAGLTLAPISILSDPIISVTSDGSEGARMAT